VQAETVEFFMLLRTEPAHHVQVCCLRPVVEQHTDATLRTRSRARPVVVCVWQEGRSAVDTQRIQKIDEHLVGEKIAETVLDASPRRRRQASEKP
jgi:hypothetical protein